MQQINHTLTYEKLGTHRYILLYEPVGQDILDMLDNKIMNYLTRFEQEYSRFRDDSLLGVLRTTGRIDNPSDEIVAMLQFAYDIEEKSTGYFSLLLADTLSRLGYGKVGGTHHTTLPCTRDVMHIEKEYISLEPGYALDFGGFGKGRAVDEVTTIVANHGINYALINGGGDIRSIANTTGYDIVLEDPLVEHNTIGTIHIASGGCAGSSPHKRKRQKDGISHHHLIDPTSQQPSYSDRIAVHTYASSALLADVASTILYVCPLEKVDSLASALGVEYFLIFDDYSTIRSMGYPDIQST